MMIYIVQFQKENYIFLSEVAWACQDPVLTDQFQWVFLHTLEAHEKVWKKLKAKP